jgi:hypothetical protein
MIEATVKLRNGDVLTVYDETFEKLFANIDEQELDIVQIVGRTIKLPDMRQGKENLNCG